MNDERESPEAAGQTADVTAQKADGPDTPAQTERTTRRRPSRVRPAVAWIGTALLVAGIASGIAVLVRTGGRPNRLANLYGGLSVADFRAQAQREARAARDLVGEDLDGRRLALSDYRGKVLVVNIWGSWCGPCRREEPDLVSVAAAYGDRGVQFIGVNVRDGRAQAKAFREEFGVTYPSFFDPSASLTYQLRVQSVPSTFIIDRGFRIFFRFTGAIDRELLETGLTAALSEGE